MGAREITVPTDLCDTAGRLSPDSVGWARHPIIRSNVAGSPLRKKKWNYWCVTSPELLFSVTISHLDYAAVLFVYALNLRTLRFREKTVLAPFGIGCRMPDEVNASVRYDGKELAISFEELGNATRIKVEAPNFGGRGRALSADLLVRRPEGHETLNVVVPWSKTRYQFTSKQEALPAQGQVRWEEETYELSEDESFGCLDFGRGKWPYRANWNWAAASGRSTGGRTVGLNLGGQWTDGTGQTENGFVVDGRLSKIHEDIVWTYDRGRYMDPWTLRTAGSNRVSLVFEPLFERTAKTNALIIRSEVHQMIGTFRGSLVADDGETIEIDGLLGWAEDHSASW
ncbi:hypothetical protein B1A99_16195 [Cohnella sp. CIP 111063]|jgi:hypothetical protein|uniref:DUF2804 domain-containing protein n=1 Tax=unclassified Cohnella TaxID=2636738 RepID=UPI000B8BE828|nr:MULTISPECIES: DUF2804 domain-containing protein [unclassified Cohnella]OXS57600.1 hypothetical protein B1A99_16195 [Cohnella sp. CIP 111063]PRX70979.1 uncharacterized protein DUF2804 [Cohnella sp. SGD-V74]